MQLVYYKLDKDIIILYTSVCIFILYTASKTNMYLIDFNKISLKHKKYFSIKQNVYFMQTF